MPALKKYWHLAFKKARIRFFLIGPLIAAAVAGCASSPSASTDLKNAEFTNDAQTSLDRPAITNLGGRLAIRASADSWSELVKRMKPNFAWNRCDLLWIETNKMGQPRFLMDEAYRYAPVDQAERIVLLEERDAPYDQQYGEVSGGNMRGVAELHEKIPEAQDDAGERGDYAVALSTNSRFGTVYEVGWQRSMESGTGHYLFGRRIYLWNDRRCAWHFLGEGPEEGDGRGLLVTSQTKVVWEPQRKRTAPLSIRFVTKTSLIEAYEDGLEAMARPELTIVRDWILAGNFPAQVKRSPGRDYLVTEEAESLDKIVKRLGAWEPSTGFDYGALQGEPRKRAIQNALAAWTEALARLNPQLPRHGNIPAGTRVEMLTSEEVAEFTPVAPSPPQSKLE